MATDRCFVDTVCWIALLNQDDRLHESADRKYKLLMRSWYQFVTTTSVLNETANALSDPRFRLRVAEFYRRLQISSRVEIIFVDPRLWSDGWQLYEKRHDKAWSLTDCISIVVIQEALGQYYLTDPPNHFTTTFCNLTPRYCRML